MASDRQLEDKQPWWALCTTFLDLAIPSLEKMIRNGQSYPVNLSYKKWQQILKEMLKGFKKAKRVEDKHLNPEEIPEKERDMINKSLELFKEHFWDLWD